MTGREDTSRSHIIPVEHPERLMARLRGWDPVVDPLGTGLLRSFQHDMFSFFEPFTPPFTDTGYIRPQMLDNAIFGYNQNDTVLGPDQENVAPENVSPQANAMALISASGVTEYKSDKPTLEDNKGNADLDKDDDNLAKGAELESTYLEKDKENLETLGEIQEVSEIGKDDKIDDEVNVVIATDADVDSENRKDSTDIAEVQDADVDPEKRKDSIDIAEVQDADVDPENRTDVAKVQDNDIDKMTGQDNTEPTAFTDDTEFDEDQKNNLYGDGQDNADMDNVQGTDLRNEDQSDSGIFQEEPNQDLNANQDPLGDEQSRQENAYISGLDINDQDQTNTTGDAFGISGIFPVPLDLRSLQANTYEVFFDA